MAKILVVTYSRTGSTVCFGQELASFLRADVERIQETEHRIGSVGYMVSALEALAKGLPTIRTRNDPSRYDVVVVGTPVWAGNMASPIRSYLTLHRAQLRHVAFFAVMGGRGAEQVVREMKFLTHADDAPSCTLTQSEVAAMGFSSKLTNFGNAVADLARRVSAPLSIAADASTWIDSDSTEVATAQ